MNTPPVFELVTPTAQGASSRRIALGPKIAAGAAGTVYHLHGDTTSVIKIYHESIKAKDLDSSRRQVEAMVKDPPDLPPFVYQGQAYVQIAWPTGLVMQDGRFAGFSMPALEMQRTKVLEYLLQDKQAVRAGLRSDLGTRVTVARQLAGVVAALHAKGHYVVDMKPVNLSFYPDTLYMAVLDCDGFNIHDDSNGISYPAPMFTVEYLAPEFQVPGGNPNTDPKAQDRFALAVIIFQLLCHGTHPYSGVLSNRSLSVEIKDRISRGDFPYGRVPNPNCTPIPSSTYKCLPDELVECFERAFERDSSRRPSAQEWTTRLEKYATKSTNNLVQCKINPNHRHFAGLPCSRCALDRFSSGQTPLQFSASHPTSASTSSRAPPPIPGSTSTPQPSSKPPPPIPRSTPPPIPVMRPPPISQAAQPPAPAPIYHAAQQTAQTPVLQTGPARPSETHGVRNALIGFVVLGLLGGGAYFAFTDHSGFTNMFTDKATSGDIATQPTATASASATTPLTPDATSPAPVSSSPAADAAAAAANTAADAAAAAAAASPTVQPDATGLATARDALAHGNLIAPANTNAVDLTLMAWKLSPAAPESRALVVDVLKALSAQQALATVDKNGPLATLYQQKTESLVTATIGQASPEWSAYQAEHSAGSAAIPAAGAPVNLPDSARTIAAIIQAAERGDWAFTDNQVEALKLQVPPATQGDRKSARQLNAQGLAALNQHDYQAAIQAFISAHQTDPADIEVSNNLGSAYQQAGQNTQAIDQLGRTLAYAPTRAPAWENLAHVYAQSGNLAASEACARLTLRYSKNPVKTVTYMTTIASANPDGVYERVLAKVLRDQPPPAQLPLADSASTGPATPAAADARQPGQQSQQMDEAVRGMLAEGQACFTKKNYTCAITSASNALRFNPASTEARQLKERAQAAQAQAMSDIDLH